MELETSNSHCTGDREHEGEVRWTSFLSTLWDLTVLKILGELPYDSSTNSPVDWSKTNQIDQTLALMKPREFYQWIHQCQGFFLMTLIFSKHINQRVYLLWHIKEYRLDKFFQLRPKSAVRTAVYARTLFLLMFMLLGKKIVWRQDSRFSLLLKFPH